MKIIAHIHTDFPDKFGIPRQSGLVKGLTGQIVFEPEYRNPEIVKGIDEFTHISFLPPALRFVQMISASPVYD